MIVRRDQAELHLWAASDDHWRERSNFANEPICSGAAEAAQLRLVSSRCVRWSVTDNTGGAWFPAGVLAKWDYHNRPFFHGHDLSLTVPAEPLHVVCTRGLEYERAERAVEQEPSPVLDLPELLSDGFIDSYTGDSSA